ncbi:uncharacterized protein LOC144576158 [Carex rostrata]
MGLPIRSSKDSKGKAKAAEEEPPTSIDQCLVDAEAEMGLPIRSSKDSKQKAKAAEEEPPTSIDQCLVDAVLHPQFREKLLSIEAKIQQALRNPNLERVEFPECHTFHLKSLADKLARHYRLESRCKERIAFARKTPYSKIPSVTLSGIPELNCKDKLPILVKRSNGAASSSTTLSLPELTDPVKREEEYYKARERIFNELGPSSSTAPLVSSSTLPVASSSILPVVSSFRSPVVSRSTSHIHSRIGEEVDQDMSSSSILPVVSSSRFLAVSTPPNYSEIGKEVDQYDTLSDMHSATNPVNNPGANMASKSILPVVSSSRSLPVSRSSSPIHSGIGPEVNQDGLNDMNAATNPVHNPGASMASSFRSSSVSRSASPIYSEIGNEVDQDGLSDMHIATNPVNNPGANMNQNPTNSMYGRGTGVFNRVPTTGQQPLPMQNSAITYQHQAMQYEPIIQQPQMYQYVSSIQVPITGQQPLLMQNAAITSQHQAMQHELSIQQLQMYQYVSSIQQPQMMQYEPSIAQPYIHTPYYSNYPYDTSSGLYNLAHPTYPQWPWVQPMETYSQQPIYPYVSTSPYASSAPQLVLGQPVPLFRQEPMQYLPGTAQQPSNSFIQLE